MTDQEMTEIVATKVMGWFKGMTHWQDARANPRVPFTDFSPLTSDADCMMAWDRFSEDKETRIGCKNGVYFTYRIGGAFNKDSSATNPDRRRAMVECMVKAVAA